LRLRGPLPLRGGGLHAMGRGCCRPPLQLVPRRQWQECGRGTWICAVGFRSSHLRPFAQATLVQVMVPPTLALLQQRPPLGLDQRKAGPQILRLSAMRCRRRLCITQGCPKLCDLVRLPREQLVDRLPEKAVFSAERLNLRARVSCDAGGSAYGSRRGLSVASPRGTPNPAAALAKQTRARSPVRWRQA